MRFKLNRLLFLFTGLSIATLLSSCENNISTVNLLTSGDKTPLLLENNADITYTDSAKLKFHLKAPLIESYGGKDPEWIFSKGVSLDFYNDSTMVNGHLEAGYALRHINSGLMEADNNVILVNKNSEQLNTEQLFYSQNKDSIYTDKFVRIKTANEIIFGDGFVSNDDFTHYHITNIRGVITIQKPEK